MTDERTRTTIESFDLLSPPGRCVDAFAVEIRATDAQGLQSGGVDGFWVRGSLHILWGDRELVLTGFEPDDLERLGGARRISVRVAASGVHGEGSMAPIAGR